MKLLLLGPRRPELINYLSSFRDEVLNTDLPLLKKSEYLPGIDFIISYGYRHILKKEVLDIFPQKAINLHISLLPWNRGADPNLWSFLEDTPKGVTIHYLDAGVDTGEILAQKEVDYRPGDTLRTSYERLTKVIEDLFRQTWPLIRRGRLNSFPQLKGGSYHRKADREEFNHLLVDGWDTPVINLIGKALNDKRL